MPLCTPLGFPRWETVFGSPMTLRCGRSKRLTPAGTTGASATSSGSKSCARVPMMLDLLIQAFQTALIILVFLSTLAAGGFIIFFAGCLAVSWFDRL